MTAQRTIDVALLHAGKDEDSLVVELGQREQVMEIVEDPAQRKLLEDDPALPVPVLSHMGLKDEAKKIGLRILARWSKELHGLVCNPKTKTDEELADSIKNAVVPAGSSIEVVLIGATATALLAVNAPAAVAAIAAPLLVKKIIIPMKDELCEAWGEANAG